MVLGLIAFLAIVYIVQINTSILLTLRFSAIPEEILTSWYALSSGNFTASVGEEFFTLFSYSMLHGSFVDHLAGNLFFLWVFAAVASELLSARWVIPIFVFTAITGGLCHMALNPTSNGYLLGASGAVMGFQGLYLAMSVRWHLPDPHVWPIASPVAPSRLAVIGVLFLLLDFRGYLMGGSQIAYGAHLGGFIGGLFLGGFIVPMPRVALPR